MVTIDRIHTPALQTTLPRYLDGAYEVLLAAPERDRPGTYPTWTVLAHRASDDEYVIWTAVYNDDTGEWSVEIGEYYRRSPGNHAERAVERFWARARSHAWSPS